MLQRRFYEHVKAHNWFAVASDFVIVVIGVFLGIQVSNWNDSRVAYGRETDYLRELRDEIVENNAALDARIVYTRLVIDAGGRISTFLRDAVSCGDDCERIVIDAFHSSQRWANEILDVVASEMSRQGLPRSTELKKRIRSYYQADNGSERDLIEAGLYRERVRRILPIPRQQALWRECFRFDSETEEIIRDCSTGATPEEARRDAEALLAAADLHDDLNYWISQNVIWLAAFEDQARRGQSLLAAIDEELERRE
jgi:hypothetical protein